MVNKTIYKHILDEQDIKKLVAHYLNVNYAFGTAFEPRIDPDDVHITFKDNKLKIYTNLVVFQERGI